MMAPMIETVGILARLTPRGTTWKKVSAAARSQVAQAFEADDDWGNPVISLIAREDRLPIQSFLTATRQGFKEMTLPWASDNDWRIVLTKQIQDVEDWVHTKQLELRKLVDELAEKWDDVRQRAPSAGRLATIPLPATPEFLYDTYSMEWRISAMPSPEDAVKRLGIDATMLGERLAEQLANELREAEQHARQDLANRLYEPVKKLAEHLAKIDKGQAKLVQQRSMDALAKIASTVKALNFDSDTRWDDVCDKVASMANFPAAILAGDDGAQSRTLIRGMAEKYAAQMKGLLHGDTQEVSG